MLPAVNAEEIQALERQLEEAYQRAAASINTAPMYGWREIHGLTGFADEFTGEPVAERRAK